MAIQEARHVYPLVCDHDRELMRKSMEAVAFASCGEPTVVVGQQGQQSERVGHEAWINEEMLTPPLPLDLFLNAINPYDLGATCFTSSFYPTQIFIFVNPDVEVHRKVNPRKCSSS